MPVTWDATAEAKLMAAIFMICDVKVSAPQLKELAGIMGSDCTPKAISHRLTKLRKAGVASSSNTGTKYDGDGEPKTKKIKTTPDSVKKGGRQPAKKRATTPMESDDEENAAQPTPPTTVDRTQRSRGVKRSYEDTEIKEEVIDDEDDDQDDGIKVGEDIGQGLRATRPDYRSEAEGSDLSLPTEP